MAKSNEQKKLSSEGYQILALVIAEIKTNDAMPPKRSWWKEYILQWLNVPVKAELLEIAMKNLPEKRYEIDEAVKQYNVDILRLPINHVYNIEETFKKSYAFPKQLEEDLLDGDNDEELNSEIEEMS